MAERTLRKRVNDRFPCVLVRPSIIISAMHEPTPGWTDTLSAAGGLSMAVGTGMVNYIYGKFENIADLVPVDIVSNIIIVSTAMCS